MMFIGFAIYQNQVGRFLRDWSPVALMFLIYGIALELVGILDMPGLVLAAGRTPTA